MTLSVNRSLNKEMVHRTLELDLSGLRRVDVGTIDWLARLNFAARQAGIRLQLKNVSQALVGLIQFCGLAEALGVEPKRQAE